MQSRLSFLSQVPIGARRIAQAPRAARDRSKSLLTGEPFVCFTGASSRLVPFSRIKPE